MFDRTEPAIGRTSRQTEAISLGKLRLSAGLFLFATWLSLPSPHGSDRCANTGKRTLPDTPDLQILHVHTRQNLEDNPMRFDPVECGKRIKVLRENKNLTRAQLAEQLNISFDHMRMAERGKRACSIDLLVDLSLILEVSLDYLILGKKTKIDPIKDELNKAIEMLEKIKVEL